MTVISFRRQFSSGTFRTSGGAHDQDRTGDLVLTKDALYRLSYVGLGSGRLRFGGQVESDSLCQNSASYGSPPEPWQSPGLERETGLEPATNSLEGYDSAN
jgi:hypothetical protein